MNRLRNETEWEISAPQLSPQYFKDFTRTHPGARIMLQYVVGGYDQPTYIEGWRKYENGNETFESRERITLQPAGAVPPETFEQLESVEGFDGYAWPLRRL